MTTLNETYVNSFKINRLTKTQLNNATNLSPSEAYWEDPEFVGGKLLETTADGDIVESSQTIPTKTSDLSNDSGFISGITSAMVTTALGYSPVNPTALAEVATSGSYNDLSNKPTIPTVNNPTITITQGGVSKGSFTLNQSTGDTIALDAGGGSSVDIDNVSITKNGDDEIQTIGVINQNNTLTSLKQWSGTKAQYDAIATKDSNTVYNITDDTTPSNFANVDLSNLSQTGQAVIDGKVDLNLNNINPSATAKETIVGWGMPDYTSGVAQSGTSFTAPSDGWVYIVRNVPQNSYLKASIDDIQISYNAQRLSTACDISELLPISKNSIFETVSGTSMTFFPCKGV